MKKQIGILILALFPMHAAGQGLENYVDFIKDEAKRDNELASALYRSGSNLTENQKKYDVRYYGLDFDVSPENREIKGEVIIHVRTLSELTTLELNFPGYNVVHGVSIAGSPGTELTFRAQRRILEIELDRTYAENEDLKMAIEFTSIYEDWVLNFTKYQGLDLVFTWIGDNDRTWFPNKLSLEDKADSVDMRVTVPDEMVVAANGSLKQVIQNGDSSTYVWQERYPITPVIIAFAAYPYDVHTDWYFNANKDSMEMMFFTFPDIYEQAKNVYATEKEMLSFFEERFGPYPFFEEKYGHLEETKPNSLEIQNMVFLSTSHMLNEYAYMTVAHEMAHQWLGACVSNQSWNHIWIIEGFATYASGLWYQHVNQAENLEIEAWAYYGAGTPFIQNPGPWNMYNQYLSYRKPAWIYHMLRHMVGDSLFFETIQGITSNHSSAYATITTDAFEEAFEQKSGMNLDRFFQQWVYGEYYPNYAYSWESSPHETGYDLELTLHQKQTWQLFWMPVDVAIETTSGIEKFVVWDSLETQVFHFELDESPLSVTLDPDNWLLNKASDVTGMTDYPFLISEILAQPNPFKRKVDITFEVQSGCHVSLMIYNELGQEVVRLSDADYLPGTHAVSWDAQGFRSGMYFYRLNSGDKIFTGKLIKTE